MFLISDKNFAMCFTKSYSFNLHQGSILSITMLFLMKTDAQKGALLQPRTQCLTPDL